jgi:hypothetical protein
MVSDALLATRIGVPRRRSRSPLRGTASLGAISGAIARQRLAMANTTMKLRAGALGGFAKRFAKKRKASAKAKSYSKAAPKKKKAKKSSTVKKHSFDVVKNKNHIPTPNLVGAFVNITSIGSLQITASGTFKKYLMVLHTNSQIRAMEILYDGTVISTIRMTNLEQGAPSSIRPNGMSVTVVNTTAALNVGGVLKHVILPMGIKFSFTPDGKLDAAFLAELDNIFSSNPHVKTNNASSYLARKQINLIPANILRMTSYEPYVPSLLSGATPGIIPELNASGLDCAFGILVFEFPIYPQASLANQYNITVHSTDGARWPANTLYSNLATMPPPASDAAYAASIAAGLVAHAADMQT